MDIYLPTKINGAATQTIMPIHASVRIPHNYFNTDGER
jgi:hypothetical protein